MSEKPTRQAAANTREKYPFRVNKYNRYLNAKSLCHEREKKFEDSRIYVYIYDDDMCLEREYLFEVRDNQCLFNPNGNIQVKRFI